MIMLDDIICAAIEIDSPTYIAIIFVTPFNGVRDKKPTSDD